MVRSETTFWRKAFHHLRGMYGKLKVVTHGRMVEMVLLRVIMIISKDLLYQA